MRNFASSGWQDYWNLFNELINLLHSNDRREISAEFEDAQKHINGLTDGWYEFKLAFEKSLQSNRRKMTSEQTDIADFLIMTLNESLGNR